MTARLSRAMRGDGLQKHMKAETWNAFVDTAQRVASRTGDLPTRGFGRVDVILVKNTTGTPVPAGGVLAYSNISITPNEIEGTWLHSEPVFVGTEPTDDDLGMGCVLRSEAQDGEIVEAVCAGVVPVRLSVPTDGEWITRADVADATTDSLAAVPHGAAQILWKDTGEATTVDAVVLMGAPQTVQLIGKADGTLTAGTTTGSVTVWMSADGSSAATSTDYDVTVWLDWMHSATNISSGKQVLIQWFPHERIWRVIGAECES